MPTGGLSRTNKQYLCHFQKLRQFCHPVEEVLVDLQCFFALILLHVKVFLCTAKEEEEKNVTTNVHAEANKPVGTQDSKNRTNVTAQKALV